MDPMVWEILFTVMGYGCESVSRLQTPDTDVVIGNGKMEEFGTFRARNRKTLNYGGTAFRFLKETWFGKYERL